MDDGRNVSKATHVLMSSLPIPLSVLIETI